MTTRQRAPQTRMKRSERAEGLLEAATDIILERGVEGLTMEGLAARAGVSKALPYQHFANRDEVLLAVWKREHLAFDARMLAAIEPLESTEDRFRAMLEVWLDETESWGVQARLDQPGVGPPQLQDLRNERSERVANFLADLLQADYDLGREDAMTTAAVLLGGALGIVQLRSRGGWGRDQLVDAFMRACRGAIAAVVETQAGTSPRPQPDPDHASAAQAPDA